MEFSTSQLCRIVDIKRNRLQDWLDRGFVKPSIKDAQGSGTRNLWSRNDLYSIAILKKVVESGLSRAVMTEILSEGSIDYSVSDEEVDKFNILLHFRSEKGRVYSVLMTTMVLNFEDFFDQGIDILHVINFKKIKTEIDSRIKETKE